MSKIDNTFIEPQKRVLVMPSYWPTKIAPIVGSQVQEQTKLISKDYDVRVLFCLPGMGLLRYLTHQVLKIFLGYHCFKSCEGEFLDSEVYICGFYFCDHKILPYSWRRKNELEAVFLAYYCSTGEHWKPDFIHARTAEYAGYCAAKISKKTNTPFLLTENVLFVLGDILNNMKITEYIFAIENAQKVVVVSNWLKSQLLINNIKCDPEVIGNWIDENKFEIKENKIKQFTILTAGHTGFTKDWHTFFKCIHYLVNDLKCKEIKVKIAVTHVFNEESMKFIPNKIAEYNLQSIVEVLNEVPRNKMAELYQNSNVFVSTSLNETFGIATAEAMFCGVPVVATDNGGINDFLNDENGLKVNIGDYKAIAEAILKIKNKTMVFNPSLIRESVLSKFGTEAFRKKLNHFYNQLISN